MKENPAKPANEAAARVLPRNLHPAKRMKGNNMPAAQNKVKAAAKAAQGKILRALKNN